MNFLHVVRNHPCLVFVCLTMAGAALPSSAVAAKPPSTLELMIVLNPGTPSDPPTDLPARVVDAVPITVATHTSAKNPEGVNGRVSVRVLEDGSVGRLRFESPRPSKTVEAEIEKGLSQWRFQPPTRLGKSTETWLNLVYASSPSPVPGGDTPPRSLFAVVPEYPYELWRPWARTGASAPVVSLPSDTAPKPSGSLDGSRPAPIGDNKASAPAHGRNVLGEAGAGPSLDSHAAWFSGHVTLRVDVDELGLPTGAEVVRSTASCFEPLAVAAVMDWRFSPAIAAGKPVAARMIVPMATPGTIENPPPLFLRPDPDRDESWDEPPRMRYLDIPVYPQDLLVAGITGRASARVELDGAGAITRVDLIDATKPEFGHALVASIERCLHDPARRGGRRVPVSVIRTAVFDIGLWNRKPVNGEIPALLLQVTDPTAPIAESALDQPLHRIAGRPPAFAVSTPLEGPGSATVMFVVSRDGEVQEPRIVEASSPSAGYAAIQAVATWTYAPPVSRGIAVPAAARVSFASP